MLCNENPSGPDAQNPRFYQKTASPKKRLGFPQTKTTWKFCGRIFISKKTTTENTFNKFTGINLTWLPHDPTQKQLPNTWKSRIFSIAWTHLDQVPFRSKGMSLHSSSHSISSWYNIIYAYSIFLHIHIYVVQSCTQIFNMYIYIYKYIYIDVYIHPVSGGPPNKMAVAGGLQEVRVQPTFTITASPTFHQVYSSC